MARNDDFDDQNERDDQPGPDGRNGPSLFLILLIVVGVIATSFVFQNREEANIQYLVFFESRLRIWTAIGFAIILGIVLDRLIIAWWRRARNKD